MKAKRFILAGTDVRAMSAGLLLLRIMIGLSIFLKHGHEKLTGFTRMAQHFPDPLHIGPVPSLAFALLADGICSLLLVLGLFTRPAAAIMLINLIVAMVFVHHAAFFSSSHVELIVAYIAGALCLLLAGPGVYSLDARL